MQAPAPAAAVCPAGSWAVALDCSAAFHSRAHALPAECRPVILPQELDPSDGKDSWKRADSLAGSEASCPPTPARLRDASATAASPVVAAAVAAKVRGLERPRGLGLGAGLLGQPALLVAAASRAAAASLWPPSTAAPRRPEALLCACPHHTPHTAQKKQKKRRGPIDGAVHKLVKEVRSMRLL